MTPRLILSRSSRNIFHSSSPSPSSSSSIFNSSLIIKSIIIHSQQQRRSILTFPHPILEQDKSTRGSTNLIIKSISKNRNGSDSSFKSILHIYFIIKYLEKKLNFKLFKINLSKDPDSLTYLNTIFLTTLNPITLTSNSNSDSGISIKGKEEEGEGEEKDGNGNGNSLRFEIKFPKNIYQSKESNFLGGPSLNDISRIINESNFIDTLLTSSSSIGKDKDRDSENEILQFKVEIQRNLTKKQKSDKAQKSKFKRSTSRQRYTQNGKEASDIVQALKEFKGGFYGGFDGLAEKFEHLIINPENNPKAEEGTPNTIETINQ
ncbi:uncharacterized protein L201_003253 [Kwoniella dendrophila CBS 6074]|uniref:Uncharacterized protein n=1 Tax=Kwoniella dendrophila CBS 6074 TaxID=1295534 RepID=A0AAX4JU57_9TREE